MKGVPKIPGQYKISFIVIGPREYHIWWWKEETEEKKKKSLQGQKGSRQRTGCPNNTTPLPVSPKPNSPGRLILISNHRHKPWPTIEFQSPVTMVT